MQHEVVPADVDAKGGCFLVTFVVGDGAGAGGGRGRGHCLLVI